MTLEVVSKACFCPDCLELLFKKPPKALTKLVAICNGCGRERYCSLVETSHLSPRKDIKLKSRKRE